MKLCRCLSVLVLVILLGFTETVKADLNEGLKAYYPFNGNANDESLNSYHGETNGKIGYVEGKLGTAAEFDGSQDIQIPIKLNGITENQYLSIAFWGKLNSEDSIFITNANTGDWSNSVIFSTRHIGIVGRGSGERDAEKGYWCVGVDPVLISGDLIPRSCASMIRPTINDFGYSDVDYTEWHYYALTYNNDIERVYGIIFFKRNIARMLCLNYYLI